MALNTAGSLAISWTPVSPSGSTTCANDIQKNIATPPNRPARTTRLAISAPLERIRYSPESKISSMQRTALIAAGIFAGAVALLAELGGASLASPDHPAIGYDTRPVSDAVAQLNRKIQDGQVQLKFEGVAGYLRSLLDALNIPI